MPYTSEQRQRANEARRRRIEAMTPAQREIKKVKELHYSRKRRAAFPEETKEILQRSRLKRKAEGKCVTPEQARSYTLKWRYGISKEEWENLFQQQGCACAICKSITSGGYWQTDHCHTTNDIRGILCHTCNLIVHSKVTPDILRAAANYVEEH